MRKSRIRSWLYRLGPAAGLLCLLAGCSSQAASPAPAPPTPVPTTAPPAGSAVDVTPTVSVGFAVTVTAIPIRRVPTPTPRPRPTPFVMPKGPYLVLYPASGPPISQTIIVHGGNLPPASTLQLVWSPGGRLSPIAITAYTDRRGTLSTRLAIPGTPPGRYEVIANVNGVRYASARFVVTSKASLAVQVLPAGNGETLQIRGRRFLPRLRLLLVAYAMSAAGHPVVLGAVQTNARGKFVFVSSGRSLAPGQYVLRAWSADALSAQMAEAFFQVLM